MTKRIGVCLFDAYGTLFDVHSAVRRNAAAFNINTDEFSKLWRTKQLEYSWVRTLMRRHSDFWTLTSEALDYSLESYGICDASLRKALLDSYLTLDAYPEVPTVLGRLRDRGIRTAILSNGSPSMLETAVNSAGLNALLEKTLSIEAVRIYKPDPSAYQSALVSLRASTEEVAFVSSNAWDAAGANTFGFRTFWVNRSSQPFEYGLRRSVVELDNLVGLPEILKFEAGEEKVK